MRSAGEACSSSECCDTVDGVTRADLEAPALRLDGLLADTPRLDGLLVGVPRLDGLLAPRLGERLRELGRTSTVGTDSGCPYGAPGMGRSGGSAPKPSPLAEGAAQGVRADCI